MAPANRVFASTLLAIVYLLVVTPVGLAVRLLRDPLKRRPDPSASTYWNHRRA
ncbi:hypothetical protein [Streptomyces sp. BPTC-684]|uniref:hypothetical protein n=1 Tax=Streptomyces sp. BPTC-684 TaxID=3043734 RepID=UPI0024B1DBD5|nr:hypothetical protein [Streptomyces sp. BPTC-684]WHM40040.1 hypothetical protein QIY60_26410 [Streptomyces sp. BPTC-684]